MHSCVDWNLFWSHLWSLSATIVLTWLGICHLNQNLTSIWPQFDLTSFQTRQNGVQCIVGKWLKWHFEYFIWLICLYSGVVCQILLTKSICYYKILWQPNVWCRLVTSKWGLRTIFISESTDDTILILMSRRSSILVKQLLHRCRCYLHCSTLLLHLNSTTANLFKSSLPLFTFKRQFNYKTIYWLC